MSETPDARAVILAGGLGTRVRHLLSGVPKPMAPVAGRPFLDWIVDWIHQSCGVGNFLVSTGYLGEAVERHYRTPRTRGLEIRCFRESDPMGTAGGFLNCVKSDRQPHPSNWLVANGDSLAVADLSDLLAALDDPTVAGAILGVRVKDASRYGKIEATAAGRLAGFREKSPGSGLINAGIYAFRHDIIESFPSKIPLSFEVDVFSQLLNRYKIAVVQCSGPFLDIGTEESLREAEAFIRSNFSDPSAASDQGLKL